MESARRRSAFSPGQIALVYLRVRLLARDATEGECIARPEGTRRPKTDCVVYRIECRRHFARYQLLARVRYRGVKNIQHGSEIGIILARVAPDVPDFAVYQFSRLCRAIQRRGSFHRVQSIYEYLNGVYHEVV